MYRITLRTLIAFGTWTLPVVAVIALLVWTGGERGDVRLWVGAACAAVIACGWWGTNAQHELLRVRSQAVSSTFVALAAAMPFVHAFTPAYLAAMGLVAFYFFLCASYDAERPEGCVFQAFALLCVGAYFFPPLFDLVPVMWLAMLLFLRNLTWRCWLASVFGLAVPALFYWAWLFWHDAGLTALDFVKPYWHFEVPDWRAVPMWKRVNAGFLAFQVLLAFLHYYRGNYRDKIKVRMLFYTFIMAEVFVLAGLAWYPDDFEAWMLLACVNSAPLIAHYWALARGGWPMTLWFLLNVGALVALGLYNAHLLKMIPWT